MGWTVLYIAFGIVALWLLGEVLLQYKARLRWRLLAFVGFLGVVVGVLTPSVFVITVGAIAFATGQTYVTLSFRRGFSTGWALGGRPGESRRRRGGKGRGGSGRAGRRAAAGASGPDAPAAGTTDTAGPAESPEPAEQGHAYDYDGRAQAPALPDTEPPTAVYAPEPLPDDTGQYGVYSGHRHAAGENGRDDRPQYAAYDAYADPAAHAAPGQDPFGHAPSAGGQDFPGGQDPFAAGTYDYGAGGHQQYAAYSDPYVGTGTAGGPAPYDGYGDGYDAFGGRQQQYTAPDPYAQQQYADTPPGGVWVPQQREGEQYPAAPPEQRPAQPAPYPNGYHDGSGYDGERYR